MEGLSMPRPGFIDTDRKPSTSCSSLLVARGVRNLLFGGRRDGDCR